jgi:hypothetical protein
LFFVNFRNLARVFCFSIRKIILFLRVCDMNE